MHYATLLTVENSTTKRGHLLSSPRPNPQSEVKLISNNKAFHFCVQSSLFATKAFIFYRTEFDQRNLLVGRF